MPAYRAVKGGKAIVEVYKNPRLACASSAIPQFHRPAERSPCTVPVTRTRPSHVLSLCILIAPEWIEVQIAHLVRRLLLLLVRLRAVASIPHSAREACGSTSYRHWAAVCRVKGDRVGSLGITGSNTSRRSSARRRGRIARRLGQESWRLRGSDLLVLLRHGRMFLVAGSQGQAKDKQTRGENCPRGVGCDFY